MTAVRGGGRGGRHARRVAQYLRARHSYCHYCGTRFAGPAGLEAYCRADDACADLFALDCVRLPPAPPPRPARAPHSQTREAGGLRSAAGLD